MTDNNLIHDLSVTEEFSCYKVTLFNGPSQCDVEIYTKGKNVVEVAEKINESLKIARNIDDEAIDWMNDCYLKGVLEVGCYEEFILASPEITVNKEVDISESR